MAAEQVGLIGVFDLRKFNQSYSSYISKLNTLNSATDSTATSLSSKFVGLGNSLLKVGAILSGAVVAGATVAGAALTKMAVQGIQEAADLEQQIANIAATMNTTSEEAGFLRDVIIDLGLDPQLQVTTFEAAQAIELLAKNGVFAGLSLNEMEAVARSAGKAVTLLANATGAEFGQAADISSTAMILFNRSASEMVDIVSNITAVTTNSKLTIEDYELALRNGGAAAAVAGLSLEDFNTIITASAEELGNGRKAGTGLVNFMNRLTPNTDKATDAMKELGFITADGTNRFFDMTGELKDANAISEILYQSLFGTTKIIGEVSNRTSEQNALLADLNEEYKDARDTIDYYTNGVGALLATEEEKNNAISNAQDVIDKLTPKMDELNGISSTYTETLQHLTTEQRMVALETIFGNDGMRMAIALGKEGQKVTGDLSRVTRAYGVSMSEAAMMVQNGLTEYELLQREMGNTDAIENAETRMDTLKGKLEILGGIFEAFRIEFGSQFLELFSSLAEKFSELASNEKFMDYIKNLGKSLSTLFQALLDGEQPIESFAGFLDNIGRTDLAEKLIEFEQRVRGFITPIIEFVREHSEQFITALKAIGIVLGSSVLAAIGSFIVSIIAAAAPIVALIGIVYALYTAWQTNFLGIQDITRNAVNAISGFLENIGVFSFVDQLKEAFSAGGLKGVVDEIPKALSNLSSNISTAFNDWFASVDWAQVGTTIVESIFSAMETAGAAVGNLLNMFATWIDTVDWEQLGGMVVDYLVGAIGLLLVATGVQFKSLFLFFQSVIETTDWAALGNSLLNAVGGIFEGIFSTIQIGGSLDFLAPIIDIVGKIGDAFTKLMSPNIALVKTITGPVKDAFNSLKENMVTFTPVIEQLKRLWEELQPVFEVVSEGIMFVLNGLWLFIKGIAISIGAVIATIGVILTALVTGVVTGISRALDPFVTTLALMTEGAVQFVTGIVEIFVGLFELVGGIFEGNTETIAAAFQKITDGVTDIVLGFVLTTSAFFAGLVQTIVQYIGGLVEGIIGFFLNLYDVLVGHSIIPDMVNAIIEWIMLLKTTVISYVTDLFVKLVSTFLAKTLQLLTIFQTWLATLVARFLTWRIEFINYMRELWQQFIEVVKEKTGEIMLKFTNFINDVFQKFKERDWGELGRNIVDGLISGVTSKLSAAREAVTSLASDIKASWDGFWNSHSPSKLMEESGVDIFQGFENGAVNKAQSVMDIMARIGTDLFSGFTDSIRNVLPNAPTPGQPVTSSTATTNNYTVNNDFLGNPQVTDRDSLKMILSGFA